MPQYGKLKIDQFLYNDSGTDVTLNLADLVTTGANTFTGNQSLGDNVKVQLGTGNDLQLFHDGSHSYITNAGTGRLYINASQINLHNKAVTENMLKAVEDGSVELYYNGVKKFETTSTGALVSQATGNAYFEVKALENSSSASARVRIQTTNNDANSVVEFGDPDDGDVGKILYNHQTSGNDLLSFHVAASEKWRITSEGHLENNNDTGKLKLGNSDDLQIYHDGSHSYIINTTGDLVIKDDSQLILRSPITAIKSADNSEACAKFFENGAVELYYDNVKKFETHTNGAKVTGDIHLDDQAYLRYGTSDSSWIQGEDGGSGYLKFGVNNVQMTINRNGTINIPDNNKFTCGASGDLQIYHSGNSSYVRDVGTGTLWLDTNGNDISLISDGSVSNGKMGRFWKDGAVELYYDNSKKFETTSSGITVTGSVTETSDVSLKNNINTIQNPLELIEQIRGINFTWKNNGMKSMGVIAQDVEKVFPELVHGQEGSKTLQYSGLIGALVESVKVLSAKVAALEG